MTVESWPFKSRYAINSRFYEVKKEYMYSLLKFFLNHLSSFFRWIIFVQDEIYSASIERTLSCVFNLDWYMYLHIFISWEVRCWVSFIMERDQLSEIKLPIILNLHHLFLVSKINYCQIKKWILLTLVQCRMREESLSLK